MEQIFKDYRSTVKDLNSKGLVTVAANAFNNIDAQKDISLQGSFKKTIENIKNIYWYKNHDTNETLGIITKLWESDLFLNAEMKFNLDKEISRNMYSDYKFFAENESTVKHSVGVSPVAGKYELKDGVRYVKEWRLYEISSLTKWPANDNTPTHSIKSLSEYYEWCAKEGIHTDNFILQLEQLLTILKTQQPTISLQKQSEPEFSTLISDIRNIKF